MFLVSRLIKSLLPIFILTVITVIGFFPALKRQILSPSLVNWLSPRHWWSLIFEAGFPVLLEQSDKQWASVKRSVMQHASGNILEIGSGAGHTIAYYNPEKVTRIVGIEPYLQLHPLTKAAIQRAKLADKYELVGASIEDNEVLEEYGVVAGSMDTIVCVQVLCSIPNPQHVIAEMYKLLKPGGQLVLFEHVRSKDVITQIIQHIYTHGGWHALTGCNLNRPTESWLRQLGGWSSIELQGHPNETNIDVIPHAFGRLVKAA